MSDEERPEILKREPSIKTHKDLDAWKMAMNLVEDVYQVISHYPKEEMYGLMLQTRKLLLGLIRHSTQHPSTR